MDKHPPRFSIIMGTLNADRHLRRALESIFAQSYPHVELLIQDGGSTDSTLALLGPCRDLLAYFDSAPDAGIYDAWNKALPHASGDWLLFLGADDFLAAPDVLLRCVPHLMQLPPAVIYAYGAAALIRDSALIGALDYSLHEVFLRYPSNMGLPFPATFIRASFLKPLGFDTSYRIAGDYALTAATITLENVQRLPVHITTMECGSGLSSDPRNRAPVLAERRRVLDSIVRPRAAELVRACAGSITMVQRLGL